jgi:hypothetical protein
MLLGLVGRSIDPTGAMCSLGTGKDTVADFLVAGETFAKIGLADPLKRFVRDVYGFTREQLWGPSSERNRIDTRYPRAQHIWIPTDNLHEEVCECCGITRRPNLKYDSFPGCFLTPRFALQKLGTEWGRHCWEDTWIHKAVDEALSLMDDPEYHMYDPEEGVVNRMEDTYDRENAPEGPINGVVFSDIRFKNEVQHIKASGGKIVLVYREVDKVAASAKDMAHQSENDLNEYGLDNPLWDAVVRNDSGIEALSGKVQECLALLRIQK